MIMIFQAMLYLQKYMIPTLTNCWFALTTWLLMYKQSSFILCFLLYFIVSVLCCFFFLGLGSGVSVRLRGLTLSLVLGRLFLANWCQWAGGKRNVHTESSGMESCGWICSCWQTCTHMLTVKLIHYWGSESSQVTPGSQQMCPWL